MMHAGAGVLLVITSKHQKQITKTKRKAPAPHNHIPKTTTQNQHRKAI
jgi:hypothetical protein